MNQHSNLKVFLNGILKENPIFVLVLGMCPTLATTSSAINGMSMGLATAFVLLSSNMVISLLKSFIPDKVRIPAYVVVIATFVTVVEMVMQAFVPALFESLGIFIPLIVVNCIVLGRAEAFAMKSPPLESFVDGIGNGLGYGAILLIVATLRELIGSGRLFGFPVFQTIQDGGWYQPNGLFLLAPSAFFIIGFIIWGLRTWKPEQQEK